MKKLALTGVVILSLYAFYNFLFIPFHNAINTVQASEPSLFIIILVIEGLVAYAMFITSISIAVVIEDRFITEKQDVKSPIVVREVSTIRRELLKDTKDDALVTLDEYWEIIVTLATFAMLFVTFFNQSTNVVINIQMVIISITFWISYKIGKAKHSIDIRLHVIASAIQFAIVIGSVYLGTWLVEQLILFWQSQGSPITPSIPGIPNVSYHYLILFYSIMVLVIVFLYLNKTISEWFTSKLLKHHLRMVETGRTYDEEALHLAHHATPSIMFYGVIWLISLVISSSQIWPEQYFINILLGTFMFLALVFVSLLLKIEFAHGRISGKTLGTKIEFLLRVWNSGKEKIAVGGLVGLVVVLVLVLPSIVFTLAGSGLLAIGAIGTINSTTFLLFVVCLSTEVESRRGQKED